MKNKTNKFSAFKFFGTIFFITASLYFGSLLYKTVVWYHWLNQLQQQLHRSAPPTAPLVPDERANGGLITTKKRPLMKNTSDLD